MITTFDRYLLARFFHVYVICFVASFGLFVVIDGFTNVDSFQSQGDESAWAVLARMGGYYSLQSSIFFDLAGPTIVVVTVMSVFSLLQRHSEIQPILAAGIPVFRLLVPLFMGAAAINGLLILNQEVVIPQNSFRLQASRGDESSEAETVEPAYDYATHIFIEGSEIYLQEGKMTDAAFVLPVPKIANELTTLRSLQAVYLQKTSEHPAGWLLKDVEPRFDEISLTPEGRAFVLPQEDPNNILVVTDIGARQLCNRSTGYKFLSTSELIQRIRNPSFGDYSVRDQRLHLHARLTHPLQNLIAVFLAVPLILRKESRGMVMNMAVCAGILGLLFGVIQAFLYLGKVNLISPDLAAWIPVVLSGSCCAWLTGWVQT